MGPLDEERAAVSRWFRLALTVVSCLLAPATTWVRSAASHVGSPDTWFEGQAGPYPIRVVVRAPGVVPGLAQIDVRVLGGTPRRVTVQSFAWNAGAGGAPPPDVAKPVPGEARRYAVSLWFMVATSYGVHVTVSGAEGQGTAIVPVQAVATRRLPMDPTLGWVLAALCAFLFAGLVTVVGAAVRDSTVPPGREPDAARRARASIVMVVSAVVIGSGLAGGRAWWNGVDRDYAAHLFKPFHATASVVGTEEAPRLRLTIDDSRWRGREWSPLIPDHGKLMHLFLVRDADLGALAHLHPVPQDSEHFESRLPPLPRGRYRVYADIVHESGFAQTLTASVELGAPSVAGPKAEVRTDPASTPKPFAYARTDADDSWFVGTAAERPGRRESRFTLADGSTLTWERGAGAIVERRDVPLRFRVTAPDGTPVMLEPYLGMTAHAVVTRTDGTVFAHLHPIGTVSMASQLALTLRTPADSVAGSLGRRLSQADPPAGHSMPMPDGAMGQFSIPYGFPKTGRYRLWVQVKHAGHVQTGAFDADVEPSPS